MSAAPARGIPLPVAPATPSAALPARPSVPALRPTPLAELHRALDARMTAFAGWSLPLHYPAGIRAEHLHCRDAAALFDVSHMGQITVRGATARTALEALLPTDLSTLARGCCRYSLLLDEYGGILDDLIINSHSGGYTLVVNASRSAADLAHIRAALPTGAAAELLEGSALLALQGPAAGPVLAAILPGTTALYFMESAELPFDGAKLQVCRTGYTGEDGFEISVPPTVATALAQRLLADPRVRPAGLGARDSLRLEAGLPLHGQDIGTDTNPIEAGLGFAISPTRQRHGGFPGAACIATELDTPPARCRVGLRPEGRQPVRAGALLLRDGHPVGQISSGGFSPSIAAPIAMGYVEADSAVPGQALIAVARGREHPLRVTALPFTPSRQRHRPR